MKHKGKEVEIVDINKTMCYGCIFYTDSEHDDCTDESESFEKKNGLKSCVSENKKYIYKETK